MDKADIAALLALGAAFFIAVGDVIHQRSAHDVTDEPVSHTALFLRLRRDRGWWLCNFVAAAGFGLQAAALGFGSVLLAAAVALIVTVGNPTEGHSRASLQAWTAVIAVLGTTLVACVVGARVWSGPISAVLLAVVSGSLWGLFAVLTKGVVDQLDDGVWALLRTPELYAWAVVGVAALARGEATSSATSAVPSRSSRKRSSRGGHAGR